MKHLCDGCNQPVSVVGNLRRSKVKTKFGEGTRKLCKSCRMLNRKKRNGFVNAKAS